MIAALLPPLLNYTTAEAVRRFWIDNMAEVFNLMVLILPGGDPFILFECPAEREIIIKSNLQGNLHNGFILQQQRF